MYDSWPSNSVLLFILLFCSLHILLNSKQTDHEPTTEVVNQIVRTEIKNRTLDEIVELPQELSLGFILTDNINTSRYYLNESYQLNQDKIWQIKIPRQCRMIIYFQRFDLEQTEGCVKDYFTIQTSKAQKTFPGTATHCIGWRSEIDGECRCGSILMKRLQREASMGHSVSVNGLQAKMIHPVIATW